MPYFLLEVCHVCTVLYVYMLYQYVLYLTWLYTQQARLLECTPNAAKEFDLRAHNQARVTNRALLVLTLEYPQIRAQPFDGDKNDHFFFRLSDPNSDEGKNQAPFRPPHTVVVESRKKGMLASTIYDLRGSRC